jgi:maltooligosyltrehalose trehalohydrolase
VSEGRRNEFSHFGWDPDQVPDPQAPETFRASRLDWDELTQRDHADLLAWHRHLIALRHGLADLGDPRLERTHVEVDDGNATLSVTRGSIRVFVNLGPTPAMWPTDRCATIFAASVADPLVDGTLVLPPDAVAIVALPEDRRA